MDIDFKHPSKSKKRVIKTKKKFVGDGIIVKKQKSQNIQLSDLHSTISSNLQNNTYTLLLGDSRTEFFVTEDSRKYISKKQYNKKDYGYDYLDSRGYFDSLHNRYIKTYSAGELQQKQIISEFRNAMDIATSFRAALKLDLSPIRMWQVSLAGAVLFGMVSMSMIYSNLGQSAMAKEAENLIDSGEKPVVLVIESTNDDSTSDEKQKKQEKKVEKTEKTKEIEKQEIKKINEEDKDEIEKSDEPEIKEKIQIDSVQEQASEVINKKEIEPDKIEKEQINKVSVDSVSKKEISKDNMDSDEDKNEKKEYSLKDEAEEMVEGYPIEKMLPYILEQDPEVAKYLIAMAKQESQWGKRVPVLNGQDCYNYWGYRSKRKLMGSGGHTCFNSRKDAVETVGKRINDLIYKYDRTTAKDLIVWKCGSSCEGHSKAGVDRWIGTVGSYYDELSR